MDKTTTIMDVLNSLSPIERKNLFPHFTSEDFKSIQHMSEDEMTAIISQSINPNPEKSHWFDKNICGLNKEGIKHLKELEELSHTVGGAQHVNPKLVRYLKQLKKMRLHVPLFFRSIVNPKTLYKRLVEFSKQHDIPEEIVSHVIPAIISYIETGHMRPIIFVGEKGCGKTTAVRLLVQEALRIPTKVIKVPQLDGGHGMTGDCDTYRSADVGDLAKARLSENSLLIAYVFDEIDKGSHPDHRAGIEEELLSITDESCSDIYENFLETSLVALEHCPKFMTANDLQKVSPILVDRCSVVYFPRADAARIKSISRKYVNEQFKTSLYSMIDFDYDIMDRHIDNLVHKEVTSIRKHQQLIEKVLEKALNLALAQESNDAVCVTDAMFDEAEAAILGTVQRHVGF